MTERERLIELLKTDSCASQMLCSPNCKYVELERCFEERTADYLLANGVIVPLCKAGDTVYIKNKPLVISFIYIESEITYVIQFDCWDCGDCPFYDDEISWEGEHDCRTHGSISFTANDIGKTVFLTKEEAEKALERSKENDNL